MKKVLGAAVAAAMTMAVTALALMGCSGDSLQYTYSNYHCNLTLYNSDHLNSTLASAMNALSPGVFCRISFVIDNGAKYYLFENNQGDATRSIFNAKDDTQENHRRLGQNNGLVVGFGNMDNPARFYAYDAQCPNCFSSDAIPLKSYPLTLRGTGIAVCSHCKREYNMNTGGNVVSGGGKPLERYRAQTSGPTGILHVN